MSGDRDRAALLAEIAELRAMLDAYRQNEAERISHLPRAQRGVIAGYRVRMRLAAETRAFVRQLYEDAQGETVRDRCRQVVEKLAEGPRPPGVRPLSLRRVQEIISGK